MGNLELGMALGAGSIVAASFALRVLEGEWPSGFALAGVALVGAGFVAWDLRRQRKDRRGG